jgi:hypothetical protein
VTIHQGVDEQGHPVEPGEPAVRVIKRNVPIRRSNAPIKAALIRDMGTLVDPTLVVEHRLNGLTDLPEVEPEAVDELMKRVRSIEAEYEELDANA